MSRDPIGLNRPAIENKISSELQVRELFFKYAEKLGFRVVVSQSRFPDYILEGKSGFRYKAEAEYNLADFIHHDHDPHKVDFIIFWKDTLQTIPRWYAKKYGGEVWLGGLIDLKKELAELRIQNGGWRW